MKKSLLYASIVVAVTTLSGCGPKDEGYKTVDRSSDEVTVSSVQNNLEGKFFLYRRMMGETPRFLTAASGKQPDAVKLTTIKLDENGINIYQVDSDNVGGGHTARFNSALDLAIEQKPILTIPGKYIDYKCTEDSYDKCTNKEEVDTSEAKSWKDKRFFVPDYAHLQVHEKDWNDIFGLNCVTKTIDPILVQDKDHGWDGKTIDLKNGVINIELRNTYTVPADASCISDISPNWDFDNLSFNTTEYFSIVARDSIVSKNYKTVPYEYRGRSNFGFFTTSHKFRDENGQTGIEGYEHTYLDRFNPIDENGNKNKVTYYLSNTFWDTGENGTRDNGPFLAAAQEAEAIINTQNNLYQTGLPTIVFAKANNIRYGDLRHSFLRLFDKPLDNGLLGVANFSSDPLTGEIVSGGFNQYSANFLGNAAYDYDRLVRDYNHGRLDPENIQLVLNVKYPANDKVVPALTVTNYSTDLVDNTKASVTPEANHKPVHNAISGFDSLVSSTDKAPDVDEMKNAAQEIAQNGNGDAQFEYNQKNENQLSQKTPTNLLKLQNNYKESKTYKNLLALYQGRLAYLSENNMLSQHARIGAHYRTLPIGVKGYKIDWKQSDLWVNGLIGGQLKKLNDLPKSLREDMVIKTAAVGFVGTVIHEFGHSIGLRHNFAASRDYSHLFSKKELKRQKVAFTKAGYPDATAETDSTSQMEYAVDMFGMAFGPYDLAAIRFGYKREVQDNRADLDDWNNPQNWHSLEKYDEERLNEWSKGIMLGDTREGSYKMMDEHLSSTISDLKPISSENGFSSLIGFGFCTDGNADLNTNCARFDAGFTQDQMSQFYIDRYLTNYTARNTRNKRANYNEFNIFNYILARNSEFNNIHSFLYDVSSNIDRWGASDDYMDVQCQNDDSQWYCDKVHAKNRIAKFFMQVLTQPDAVITFNFEDENGDQVWKNPSYAHLDSWMDDYQYSLDWTSSLDKKDQLKSNEVITTYNDAPKVMDILVVKEGINPSYQAKFESFKPIIEVHGRSLNSSQSPIGSSTHPYSNDLDKLGVWPDRLLAMQKLVTHHVQLDTTDIGHLSLVTYQPVQDIFKSILCRMALGNTDATIITHGEDNCVKSAIGTTPLNWNGITKLDDIYPLYDDMVDKYIEALPNDFTRLVKRFGFDTDEGVNKGRTNLLHAMLKQVVMYSTDSDPDGQEEARQMREFVGIHESTDNVTGTEVTVKGKQMIVTNENILALTLNNEIQNLTVQIPQIDASNKDFITALTARLDRDKKALNQLPIVH